MSKQEQLLIYCKKLNRPFSSIEVRRWGMVNYYARATRTVRQFVDNAFIPIRRIKLLESKTRGLIKEGGAPIAYYETCDIMIVA